VYFTLIVHLTPLLTNYSQLG